jgi:hypothetical protein
MGKPIVHAQSSARKFGGKPEDYLKIHQFIDSSGTVFPDVRHRALTHTNWFLRTILPAIFGEFIRNSKGQAVSVIDIGECHVLEDYGGKFIPSPSDFINLIPLQKWMTMGTHKACPPSHKNAQKIVKVPRSRVKKKDDIDKPNVSEAVLVFGPKSGIPLNLELHEPIHRHKSCNLD